MRTDFLEYEKARIVFAYSKYKWVLKVLKGLPLCVAALFLYSCNKYDIPPTYSKAKFTISLRVGATPLIWDSVNYYNAAGNKYDVETANFYISNVTLKAADGVSYSSKKVFYIDPSIAAKSTFSLDSIPPAEYSEITFLIGLDADRNKTLALGSAMDNLVMAWPDAMGGGYHFMKLEGRYLDTLGVSRGYAIHLGKNENLVTAKINQNMHQKYWNHDYSLFFNVNEVFANPYTYNLNFEESYTMSDSVAMLKIKNNMSDVFTITQNN